MTVKKVKAPPTKEEIKAARAVLRQVHAARRAKYKKRYRRRFRRGVVDLDFHTWAHDMRVVLQATARNVSLPPETVAAQARSLANAMAALIAERKPKDDGKLSHHRRTPRWSKLRAWHIWQEMFDVMIHEMAARSELSPNVIVDRACCIADASMPWIKKRFVGGS